MVLRTTVHRVPTRVVLIATLTLSCLSPTVQGEARSGGKLSPHPSRGRLFHLLDSRQGVHTLGYDRGLLSAVENRKEGFRVTEFPIGHESIELELRPFRVASEQTRYVLGRKDGPDMRLDFDPSRIAFFSGQVVDHAGSHVFLALSDTLSTGSIDLGPGRPTYRLSSRPGRGRAAIPGQVTLFRGTTRTVGIDVPLCGIDLKSAIGLRRHQQHGEPASPAVSIGTDPIRDLRTIELAFESDYEYFELFGDVDAAAAYATVLAGAVSQIYIRDTNYRYELTYVRIWDTPDDLYNDPDGFDAFYAFVDYWQTNMGAVQRDAAQYLSGRRDLPFGGIAYLDVICTYGYSMAGYLLGFFPDPDIPSVYHYDIEVSAHELGHNCGSPHTDAYNPPIDECYPPPTIYQRGTIMSYCSQAVSGGNAVHELRFHTRVQARMQDDLDGLGCVIDDCNMNNVADATDIDLLTSLDENSNGVPDECEDCDHDGVLDPAEIAGGAPDLNGNGIPDGCEPDCNGNGVPDDRDIDLGTSTDAYGNNIPDECEADCNENEVSDFTEIQADLTLDINRNTLLDGCEDCDGNGTTDAEALDGAHNAWIASDLLGVIGEYHAETGVLVRNAASGWLADAQDVVISNAGRILVSSALDDRVVEFDRSGAYVGDFVGAGHGGLNHPTGMLLVPGGNLLVSSRDTNSVIEYDATTGAHVGVFVGPGSGGLVAPFGLARNPAGNLFVTSGDNRVLEYSGQNGTFVGVFVSALDNGGLMGPRGMAFKPDGNLLVAGHSSDNVYEYDGGTGAFLRIFHNGGTVYGPWGVKVGSNGNVFITRDYEIGRTPEPLHATTTRIYEYDPITGNHLRSYVLGDDTGLSSPTGFAFMPGYAVDCNVNYVLDACDIASGLSLDLNEDGTPDECGACCTSSGCEQMTQAACDVSGPGVYHGSQSTCDSACQGGIPTVSEWGLISLSLLLLTAGAVAVHRRRSVIG